MTERFDIDLLDPFEPFEIDATNQPHLFKHAFERPDGRPIRITISDVLELYAWGDVMFFPADLTEGDAHWLLVGEVEGVIITVPLAPPTSGDPTKCRPIGLYPAAQEEQDRYRQGG